MRVARALLDDREWLVRVEVAPGSPDVAALVVPVRESVTGPGRDPVREALAEGLDLSALPAVAEPRPLGEARLLAPVRSPEKVLAIGLNYADHARESGAALPSSPVVFAKTPNSIVGPGDVITWAGDASTQVDYEAELAVVIGAAMRDVPVERALDHVLGYTCCNDVSARDAQFGDGQWLRGKSFDTFCPLGPWIVTPDDVPDPQALAVRCTVDGELLQDGTTADMVFGVAEVLAYLSRFMTLQPGDVVATGTPVGVGFARTPPVFLRHGTTVEVEVEHVGTLRNTCAVT